MSEGTNEIVQGIVAVLLVGPIAAIVILDAVYGRPFQIPDVLVALAGPVVGYFFSQRVQKRQQDTIQTLTNKLTDGGPKS